MGECRLDGLDRNGNEAANGIHFICLVVGDRAVTQKVLLMR